MRAVFEKSIVGSSCPTTSQGAPGRVRVASMSAALREHCRDVAVLQSVHASSVADLSPLNRLGICIIPVIPLRSLLLLVRRL